MTIRFALLALLLPAIQACDPTDPCSVAATVKPSMELGVGERAWGPVNEGDALRVVRGMQGGQHIWVGVRTEGVVPGRWTAVGADIQPPQIALSLWSADGIQVGDGMSMRPLDGDEAGAELVGEELFFWGQEDGPADLSSVVLRAELVDLCGTELMDERTVTLDL